MFFLRPRNLTPVEFRDGLYLEIKFKHRETPSWIPNAYEIL